MIDFTKFDTLSFDCYGTLIDWETGIINAIRPVLASHKVEATDAEILEIFSQNESVAQRPPYKRYTEVLGLVADAFAAELGFEVSPDERTAFGASVSDWPAFSDSTAGLRTLGKYYDLVILSNVDDDLFSASAKRLGIDFTEVITAQQVGRYKPDQRNFDVLLERIDTAPERLLHVAQSLFHDIAPANNNGLSSVWVNRQSVRADFGAAPQQEAVPDLELPDLATLARLADEAHGFAES